MSFGVYIGSPFFCGIIGWKIKESVIRFTLFRVSYLVYYSKLFRESLTFLLQTAYELHEIKAFAKLYAMSRRFFFLNLK